MVCPSERSEKSTGTKTRGERTRGFFAALRMTTRGGDALMRHCLFTALLGLVPFFARAQDDVLAHLRAGHPRLLLTDEQLAAAVAAAKSDPLRAQLHARIVALAAA